MDKPTTPAGGAGSGSPRPEDSGSETGFGATGVFGTIKLSEQAEKPAPAPAIKPEPEKSKPPRTSGQFPAFGGKPLEEPVVHKVVFGGGDEASAQLLDRIRMASAERPAVAENTPAGQEGGQGNSGFTELLRTLGGENPAPAARQTPVAEVRKPAPISGFTSLLQTLNAPEPKAAQGTPPVKPIQLDLRPLTPEPPKAPSLSPPPAQDASTQGSFTEYLEALAARGPASSNAPARLPGLREVPPAAAAPPTPPENKPGSFTQLFGTFGGAETGSPAAAPVSPPARLPGLGESPLGVATPPAGNKPGAFTQLFGTFETAETSVSAPAPGTPPGPMPGLGEAPLLSMTPAAPGNKPGEFTKLFGTFGNAEPSAPAPVHTERETGYPPPGGMGSFTRMLSLEQMSAPEPGLREERMPLPGSVDYGLTPGTAGAGTMGSATPDRDPFSQPLQALEPVAPSTPPSSGVGITQLIRMLEQPAQPTAPPAPVLPVSPPQAGGPGIWTQTFASLAEPKAPAAPSAVPPSWAPAAAPAVSPAAGFPGVGGTPVLNPPGAPPTPAGPSEFTRILDASRLREMAMRGGQAEGAAAAAGGQPVAPQSPAVSMPSFAAPPLPPPPAMPAVRGMPQPGGFAPPPPPQAPALQMNFAPPAAPARPVAQPPAVKPPAAPGVGKFQQMVPLLLVMVIVLLVVLLVTVIFLMKH